MQTEPTTTDTPTGQPGAASAPEHRKRRAWPVLLLALPAFVAIWSGWVGLGGMTGFGEVNPLPGIADDVVINTAITLPIGVETYAAYALNVWLAGGTSEQAKRFARASALGSLALGAAGQIAYHLMKAAGILHAPWPITAAVACLPVAVLGMGAALHHLVNEPPALPAAPALVGVPAPVEALAPVVEPATDPEDEDGPQDGPDDAEARTERAVIVNELRERHPHWPDEVTAALAEMVTAAENPVGVLPTPAPRAITALPVQAPENAPAEGAEDAEASQDIPRVPVVATSRQPGRTTSTRVKALGLREKHPDWTVAKIAKQVGVTERTVRRYLNAEDVTENPAA